jgi:hypothetical protein
MNVTIRAKQGKGKYGLRAGYPKGIPSNAS